MYAIIETGGRQFRAEPGETVRVPKLAADVGDEVTFDRVLLARTDEDIHVGEPVVKGAAVAGEVVDQVKGDKIIVFKWKRRKDYRRKQGHRQKYTDVRISEIRLG